jgi:hypothetical protein
MNWKNDTTLRANGPRLSRVTRTIKQQQTYCTREQKRWVQLVQCGCIRMRGNIRVRRMLKLDANILNTILKLARILTVNIFGPGLKLIADVSDG